MRNANIVVTMAFVSIVVTSAMSYATTRYGDLDTNSTVHFLRWFLNNRKTKKSGCIRCHAPGRFLLPTSSVLLQVVGRVCFASLSFGSTSIHSHALLDSGASTCFIDISFARTHHIPTVPTSQPISIEAIDGWVLSSGAVTKATIPLVLQVGPHHEVLTFYLISTPHHSIVLGLSWLTHNPIVDWCNCSITFSVRPIPGGSLHSIESVAVEAGLITTLTASPRDFPFGSTICPHNITTLRTYSRSKMPIGYRLIAPTIAQSNFKLASIHHSVLSMGYPNPSLRLSAYIWLATL